MKRYEILFLLLLFTFVAACKKKEGDNQNFDPNKQEGSNYMSTKSGSWWLFGARNGDVTKRMATGTDSNKNGLLFSYFIKLDTNTQYPTPEYFGKNQEDYVSLFDMDGSETNYVTLIFLKDSVHATSSWTNTEDYKYGSLNTNLLVESNVEFVDGTLTLGDSTYKNVTKVHNNLKAKLATAPTYSSVGKLDIWFARGIGIIKEEVDVNLFSLIKKQHTDSLLQYHIEK